MSADIDMGLYSDDTLWPLRVAYFDPEANDAEPEYEIAFMIQPNGIIRSYVVDYGEFSMRAMMESFKQISKILLMIGFSAVLLQIVCQSQWQRFHVFSANHQPYLLGLSSGQD